MARRQRDGTLKLDDRILGILAGFRCTGNVAYRHEATLDRKDYAALNEILEALGGRWNRKANGHVFPEGTDAGALLEAAMLTGSVADPKAGDFFETPAPLARRMAAMLGHGSGCIEGMRVLEPSAGHGRLAGAARDICATVSVCEIDDGRRETLVGMGFELFGDGKNFLDQPEPDRLFDGVVMNPPFSRQQDVAHVTRALSLVCSGGRVVAVTSTSWQFRDTKATKDFRELVLRLGEAEDLPAGTFRESGTMVRACLVMLTAP